MAACGDACACAERGSLPLELLELANCAVSDVTLGSLAAAAHEKEGYLLTHLGLRNCCAISEAGLVPLLAGDEVMR